MKETDYINYLAHMLDESMLDKALNETCRTKPIRRINTDLGGVRYGYGLPYKHFITAHPENYAGFAPKQKMVEWIKHGYVDPDLDSADFSKDDAAAIIDIIDEYGKNVNTGIRGAAVAKSSLDFSYDEADDSFEDFDGLLDKLDQAIIDIQQTNPAFKEAEEIFFVAGPSGEMNMLIAIWCTDYVPVLNK